MANADDFIVFETLMKGFYARNGLDYDGDDVAEVEIELGNKRIRLFPHAAAEGRLVCVVDFSDEEERAVVATPAGLANALRMNAEALLAEDFHFALDASGAPVLIASYDLRSLVPDGVTAILRDAVSSVDLFLMAADAPPEPEARPAAPGEFIRG